MFFSTIIHFRAKLRKRSIWETNNYAQSDTRQGTCAISWRNYGNNDPERVLWAGSLMKADLTASMKQVASNQSVIVRLQM